MEFYDTSEGAFVLINIGAGKNELYRYASTGTMERISTADSTAMYPALIETRHDVFLLRSDSMYQVDGRRQPPIKAQDSRPIRFPKVHEANGEILVSLENRYLYRLRQQELSPISEWSFGAVQRAASTEDGVLVQTIHGVYRLATDGQVEEVAGETLAPTIDAFRRVGKDLYLTSTNGLFIYSHEHGLTAVDGDLRDRVHSIHGAGSGRGMVVLASKGIFLLSDGHPMKILDGETKVGARTPGVETADGIFFLDSDNTPHRVTDAGRVLPVPWTSKVKVAAAARVEDEEPRTIANTPVGILLATNRGLYRFRQRNEWALVPSYPLGTDIVVKPVPKANPSSTPVYVETSNGVYRWLDYTMDHLKATTKGEHHKTVKRGTPIVVSYKFEGSPCVIVPGAIEQKVKVVAPAFPGKPSPDGPPDFKPVKRSADSTNEYYVRFEPSETSQTGKINVSLTANTAGDESESLLEDLLEIEIEWTVLDRLGAAFDSGKDLALKHLTVTKVVVSAVLGCAVLWLVWKAPYFYRIAVYRVRVAMDSPKARNQIFISYRRSDTGGWAANMYAKLCDRFDRRLIFYDRDARYSGSVFPEEIEKAVEQCSVVLVLIASDWMDSKGSDSKRRLDDPQDLVRQEIAWALEQDKLVIPVVFEGAVFPSADLLPEPLKPLAYRDAVSVQGDAQVQELQLQRLIERLAALRGLPPPRRA